MKFSNYLVVTILVATLFSLILFNNKNFFRTSIISNNENESSHTFLQTSYAAEEENDEDKDEDESDKPNSKKDDKSIFNIATVGDWDCTGETEDTVKNIVNQNPELVLALGDFSYSGDADCWLELIEPIADKTKITMGNHEDPDDYMDFLV